MSSKVFEAVREFMGCETTVFGVAHQLSRMEAVIIQLNVGDNLSFSVDGGPYIIIWRADDDMPMFWQSSDDYLENSGWRCGADDGDDVVLACNVYDHAYTSFKAYLANLKDDHARFKNHLRSRLDLDCDYMRSNRCDRELAHSEILRLLNESTPLAATPAQQTQVSQTETGAFTMSNAKITAIVSRAKSATVTAATLQAGKALNITAIKMAKSKAPMMVRGYLDHPAAPALLAVGLVSISEFLPDGPAKVKVAKAADLMLTAAVVDGADKFLNVEAMIDQMFSGLPPEVKTLISE